MAGLSFKGSVQEVTQSTFSSTGPFQLNGVPSTGRQDRQTFVTGIGNGGWAKYRASDANGNWEVGFGQVTSGSPDTLSRTAALVEEGSAGAGVLVDFPQGQVDVVCIATGYDVMPPKLSKTAAYTMTLLDRGRAVEVNATSAPVTITLPSAATAGDGFIAIVGKIDASANAVTIACDGSDTVAGGATSLAMNSEQEFVTLRSDGVSNWREAGSTIMLKDALWGGLPATGSSGAYDVTSNADIAPYEGMAIRVIANHDNPDGGSTLNLNTTSDDAIKLNDGSVPYAGAIKDGGVYDFRYNDSSQWILLNPVSAGPTVQTFTSNGTWTKPSGCKRIVVEAVGAGGGGGGCDGQGAGTYGAAGGGAAGAYGMTEEIDVTGISSGTVTIGTAGAAGASAAGDGGDGTDTTFNDGTTTWRWKGGNGGVGETATAAGRPRRGGISSGIGTGTGLRAAGAHGGTGISLPGGQVSGFGASTPFGLGGAQRTATGGNAQAGETGFGYGSGGSGACTNATASDAAGGAGAPGYMRIWEFY